MALAVLDSNALIYYVGGFQAIPDIEKGVYAISSVTVFELLRFPGMSEQEETSLLRAIDYCEITVVTEAIALRAAFLNRIRP
jgi:predicted nucleic acid-binding protein